MIHITPEYTLISNKTRNFRSPFTCNSKSRAITSLYPKDTQVLYRIYIQTFSVRRPTGTPTNSAIQDRAT
ncbi:hypothetical protein DPMN_103962 [Dreissena polymorpha]|uniref:Uncharacterized protein n=1 Tax=Dreissena polymorpha TaxID=45954 RepID=A0A9D4HB27_DREPO|nr:hypothetical protein DPMN_103962 [Dreissena polymorpha]